MTIEIEICWAEIYSYSSLGHVGVQRGFIMQLHLQTIKRLRPESADIEWSDWLILEMW
jgi:hypothetical protein